MPKLKDLTGEQFGDWTVIERADDYITDSGKKFVRWFCRCKCGTLEKVWSSNLVRGASTRCKNCVYAVEDLSGKKFNRLTVIKRKDKTDKNGKRIIAWICKCDCGNESWVRGGALKGKNPILSCGCKNEEVLKEKTKKDRISHLISIALKVYKSNAKKRDIAFDLTIEEFRELIEQPCNYCGEAYSNEMTDTVWRGKKSYEISNTILKYNGIDRVDNELGYNNKNCVPCCSTCNKMKSNYTFDNFIEHVEKIVNYSNTIGISRKQVLQSKILDKSEEY